MKIYPKKGLFIIAMISALGLLSCGDESNTYRPGPGDNGKPGAFQGGATITLPQNAAITYYKENFGGNPPTVVDRADVKPVNLIIQLNGGTGQATATLDGISYTAQQDAVALPVENGQLVDGMLSITFLTPRGEFWAGAILSGFGIRYVYKMTISGRLTKGAGAAGYILNSPVGEIYVTNGDEVQIFDIAGIRIGLQGNGRWVKAAGICSSVPCR